METHITDSNPIYNSDWLQLFFAKIFKTLKSLKIYARISMALLFVTVCFSVALDLHFTHLPMCV